MSDVVCELCPRYCVIPENGAGDCRVRVNLKGKLISTVYGRPSAVHIDPMEKKPLYHFLPTTSIFSIATAGCNLHCLNCQNWQLSQQGGEAMDQIYKASPEIVVNTTLKENCQSIAYTYSEPIVFYEYVMDTAALAQEKGIKNVLVTAGYINKKPLIELCKVLDATNTDLKAFDDKFYRHNCSGTLKPVLEALVTFKEQNVWLEMTNLLIPGLNDDLSQVRRMAKWIVSELGDETPLHLSRFHPMYRMQNLPPTPAETIDKVYQECRAAGMKYVYVGNMYGHKASSTFCPRDGTLLLEREGFKVLQNNLLDGHCPVCHDKISGVWI